MPKKSITVDVDDLILKNLHILAIGNDVSRKAFVEKCIEIVGRDDGLLSKVQEELKKEKPGSK